MAFLTDRKRATGLGSAGHGAAHHWTTTKHAVALLILMPVFVLLVGRSLGAPYEEVVALWTRPLPALVGALTFLVAMLHFRSGAQIMLEDYTGGTARRVALVILSCLSYAVMAAGLLGIARLAL